MQQTLMDLNLTSTWDGTWASLNYQANVADDRKPYTCNQVADKQSADSKCPGYWVRYFSTLPFGYLTDFQC